MGIFRRSQHPQSLGVSLLTATGCCVSEKEDTIGKRGRMAET